MADTPPNDKKPKRSDASRRSVIKGAAAVAGSAAIAGSLPRAFAQATSSGLPDPTATGIDHIVVLMMENRSFDHMLGWVPGADGVQAGRNFTDTAGNTFPSFHLTDTQNCGHGDPNHGYPGARTQFNNGALDGFLKTQKAGDQFPIGYFSATDVAFFSFAQKHWTLGDKYHCSVLGPTWPNRFYMHSGQTDRLTTGGTSAITGAAGSSIAPTIWDLAAAAGVSAKYYAAGTSFFTAVWGTKYNNISFPLSQFMTDAAAGQLPAITYIDPNFVGEGTGTGNDDHPLNDIRNGQLLMNQVYTALTTSPNWANTLLIINYDEWGGFADHVVPPLAPVSSQEYTVVKNGSSGGADGPTNMARLGFRVPLALIGPRARRGAVVKTLYDAVSILNMISWRFGLPTPWVRASTSINMATALNFSSPANPSVPAGITIPAQQFGRNCSVALSMMEPDVRATFEEHFAEHALLKEWGKKYGFPVA